MAAAGTLSALSALLRRAAITAACVAALTACALPAHSTTPKRIVSLNVCTDQLLMLLAPAARIAAISHIALDPANSAMVEQARRHRITYGKAEEVFLLRPDLVLAGTYTTRATVGLLRRLGTRVLEIPMAETFADIANNIRTVGEAVGESARAAQLIRQLYQMPTDDTRTAPTRPLAAVIYPNRYSDGGGTLANHILERGGFANLSTRLGIRGTAKLSLETLLLHSPDALILGRQRKDKDALAHEVFYHPVLRKLLSESQSLTIADAHWTCGTPYVVRALRRIKTLREEIAQRPASP